MFFGLISALAFAQAAAPALPSTFEATRSVQFVSKYCLGSRDGSEIVKAMSADGWSGVLEGEALASVRAHFMRKEDVPHIIVLTFGESDLRTVVNCVVDGSDIEPRALMRAMLAEYGAPNRIDDLFVWRPPALPDREIVMGKSLIKSHKGEGPFLALIVRPTNAEQRSTTKP